MTPLKLAASACAVCAIAAAQTPSGQDRRIDDLLRRMTLQEKVGQLTQFSLGMPTGPGSGREDYETLVRKGDVGSLLNVVGANAANRLQHIAVEQSRLHIPLLFGYDVIHGHRTIFPIPLALAATFDPQLVETTARNAATEARRDGINWVFSPMVDIARDARWGRISESAGEDPYLGSAMARAYIRGYQGKDLTSPDAVAACVKHFAAYGAAVAGRDYNTVDMSETQLRQVYLPSYHAAIDEGVATVMTSFNLLNGIASSANQTLMTGILRDEWKFPGTVVSDWAAIRELIPHGLAADLPDAARLALHAGTDVDMESDAYRTAPEGKLPTTELDQAVRRVLKLKTDLGLFEHPYVPDSSPYQPTQENLELARKAAEQSFVLLRNDDHLLPLDVSKVKLALIGPFADDKGEMLGSWSASGNAIDVHTLREELTARLGDRLAYQKGTEILGNSTDGFAAAVTAVQHSDVAVLTLGESGPNMTGEASSRAHLDLPGNQKQLLEAVVATGKPVVLLLFNGRPLAIPWAAQHVTAILDAWFPGLSAGPALANVLFGNVNPSGKLPVEFPHSVGQEPLFLSQLPTGRPAVGVDLTHSPANAREKYLSRYIDETNDPVYPFGWGLSYSTFEYSHPAITIAPDGSSLRVKATLTNTGNLNASEIAQLYFRRPVAVPAQPVRELKGFERITLKPGESHDLSFTITQNDLAFYDGRELKKAIDGKLQFWVGGNSNTTNEVDAVSADRVFRVTQ